MQDNKFLCDSLDECISLEKVCDKKADCADGSDEGQICHATNKSIEEQCLNCKQMAECKAITIGTVCFCKDGYRFNKNLDFAR